MTMNNLTIDGEFRYIIQWFNEWSELQREDFIPVMVEYFSRDSPNGVYMNGIINSTAHADIKDRPMSLFQCRVKLFREWSPKWPVDFKHKLKEKINEIDSNVYEKMLNELKQHNGSHSNDVNENGSASSEEINVNETVMNAPAVIVEPVKVEEISADNQIEAKTHHNELPIDGNDVNVHDDDDDDNDDAANAALITVPATTDIIEITSPSATIITATTSTAAAPPPPPTTTASTTAQYSLYGINETHAEPAEQVQMPTQEHGAVTVGVAQTISNNAEVPLVA